MPLDRGDGDILKTSDGFILDGGVEGEESFLFFNLGGGGEGDLDDGGEGESFTFDGGFDLGGGEGVRFLFFSFDLVVWGAGG